MVQGMPTVLFKEKSEMLDFGRRTFRGHMKASKISGGLLCLRETGIVHREIIRAKGWMLQGNPFGFHRENILIIRAQKLIS